MENYGINTLRVNSSCWFVCLFFNLTVNKRMRDKTRNSSYFIAEESAFRKSTLKICLNYSNYSFDFFLPVYAEENISR